MDERYLELLQWLTADGNISRAALRMKLSQSQVSKLLSQMEAELGVLLFERKGPQGVKALPAAVTLMEVGRVLLHQWKDAVSLVRKPPEQRPVFKITGPTLFLKNRFLPAWRRLGLGGHYQLHLIQSPLVFAGSKALLENTDAVVLPDPAHAPEFRSRLIFQESMAFIYNKKQNKISSLADVRRLKHHLRWIGYRPSRNPMDLLISRGLLESDSILAYLEDPESILDWISEETDCVTVMPAHAVMSLHRELKTISLDMISSQPLYLLVRNDVALAPLWKMLTKEALA